MQLSAVHIFLDLWYKWKKEKQIDFMNFDKHILQQR